MEGQKVEVKPVKIDEVEEWEVKKILNKKNNKRSSKVFGTLEQVYSIKWYLGKGGGLRESKRNSSRVWRKIKCRSKIIREVEYSKGKGL